MVRMVQAARSASGGRSAICLMSPVDSWGEVERYVAARRRAIVMVMATSTPVGNKVPPPPPPPTSLSECDLVIRGAAAHPHPASMEVRV